MEARQLETPPRSPQDGSEDRLKHLRDLKPKNTVKAPDPDSHFKRITKLQGTVVSAKNLPNLDTWSKSDPYCVVKGIRSNNHLVDIFVTRAVMNSLSPAWGESFHFVCPESWGLVDLVGLKLLVFDSDERYVSFMGSDDFLGGTDLDLSDLPDRRSMEFERDLEGVPRRKGAIFRKKKPRITVKVTVWHDWTPRPVEFNELLLNSMDTLSWVRVLDCHIVKARGLPNKDVRSKSDPQCVVRAVMLSGSVKELYRTAVCQDSLDPIWHERFSATFTRQEEPMLLIFDVYDDDDGTDVTVAGEHLGSAWVAVGAFAQQPRRKLELLGESQLLEGLLSREGVSIPHAAQEATRASRSSRASRSAGGLRSVLSNASALVGSGVSRLRHLKQLISGTARSTLTVECSVELESEEMPHAVFMRKPHEIREERDLEAIMPSFENSRFPYPPEIMKFVQGERARPGLLCGRDRVVWVSGLVHGASALSSTDFLGKSDPYCVVEGLSNHGQRFFIHRTRVIRDSLCPSWHESFFMAVPDGALINKLVFSIYDSDQGEATFDGPDDDFLGSATVDLAYVMNGEQLYEDIPLVGCKTRKMGSSMSGFRRNASISVEVRCERRVQPHFEKYTSKAFSWSPRERHTVSRKPGTLGYADISQNDLERQPEAPRQVLHLQMTNRLGEFAKKHKRRFEQWLETPEAWNTSENAHMSSASSTQRLPDDSSLDRSTELEQQQQQEESEDFREDFYDFSALKRAPRLPRPASLPELHTNFGRTGAVRRQFAADAEWLQGLQFRGDFEKVAVRLTEGMRQRLPVQALTQNSDTGLGHSRTAASLVDLQGPRFPV